MLVCALLVHIAHETAGAARIRHSLRPLSFEGGEGFSNTSGAARRGARKYDRNAVIASEAKQSRHPRRKHGLLRRYRSSQ
jgi:hypothetical protein